MIEQECVTPDGGRRWSCQVTIMWLGLSQSYPKFCSELYKSRRSDLKKKGKIPV